MALSTNAKRLLDLLPPGGRRARNLASLQRKLKLSQTKFDAACDELVDASLAELTGGRIARANVGPRDLSNEAAILLAELPGDGSTVGNYNLRSQIEMDDETYAKAKKELLDKQLIKVGPGYGGTVARAYPVEPGEKLPQVGVRRLEKDLYEPFADWLRSSLADQNLAFAEVKVTGGPRRYRRSSGQWSRPDVIAVQVSRYEWLPDITVEVSTYELKQAADAEKLQSVYEAAAHGRMAHRASVVIESEDRDLVPQPILDEVRRLNLGLYTIQRRPEGGFHAHEKIKPPLGPEPPPEELSNLLDYFLGKDQQLRQRYRAAIGR